jgi:hypothetical protein
MAASLVEYFAASQRVQDADPLVGLKLPPKQAVQLPPSGPE